MNYYINPETGCRTRKPDPSYSSTGHRQLPVMSTWLFYGALVLGLLYMGVTLV